MIACKKKINIQQQYLKDYACILMQPLPVKLVEKGAEVHHKHNQLVEHRLVLQEAFVTRNKTCLARAPVRVHNNNTRFVNFCCLDTITKSFRLDNRIANVQL